MLDEKQKDAVIGAVSMSVMASIFNMVITGCSVWAEATDEEYSILLYIMELFDGFIPGIEKVYQGTSNVVNLIDMKLSPKTAHTILDAISVREKELVFLLNHKTFYSTPLRLVAKV